MIEVNKRTVKTSDLEGDLNLKDMIVDIASMIEEQIGDGECSFDENNADEYLKIIYLFILDNLNKDIIATTNDVASLIHLFFCALTAAEQKNKYFHYDNTEDADGDACVEFALMSKKESVKDAKNLLALEAHPSIN